MSWNRPISLAILGAEKAGTTSLFRHLSQSPLVQAHAQREMTCFVNDDAWGFGEQYAQQKYFPSASSQHRLMKDVMLMNFPAALQRLRQSSPGVKVVVMLREPAERAWSAYNYARSRGVEPAVTFAAALELEAERARESAWAFRTHRYVFNSTYTDKVKFVLQTFGASNALVMYQSDYRERPMHYLAQISSLLGEDLYPAGGPDLKSHNRAGQARSQAAAAGLAKVLRSQGPVKRALRAVVPQRVATALRHGLLSLNRVEKANGPVPPREAASIRAALAGDARRLAEVLGHCPWSESVTDRSPAEPAA